MTLVGATIVSHVISKCNCAEKFFSVLKITKGLTRQNSSFWHLTNHFIYRGKIPKSLMTVESVSVCVFFSS